MALAVEQLLFKTYYNNSKNDTRVITIVAVHN